MIAVNSTQFDAVRCASGPSGTTAITQRACVVLESDRSMKQTIKQLVQANRDAALACKTAADVNRFIIKIACKTQQRWGKAVKAIVDLGGVDYYAARDQARAGAAKTLRQSCSHEVELYVDAKARCQRFAICNRAGKSVWYGIFFEDDQSFSYGDRNEQSACECAAARKAIWFASKIKESVGATAIRLILKVDAQWLTTLAGKAAILGSDARRFGIDLDMQWISGVSNPADRWTTAGGYKKWSDNDLAALARPVDECGSVIEPEPVAAPEIHQELEPDRVTEPMVTVTATTPEPMAETINREDERRTKWFAAHGAEWPGMRDAWKSEGLSSSARDSRLNKIISEWSAVGEAVSK